MDATYGGANVDYFNWHEDAKNKITCLFYIIDEPGQGDSDARPEGGDLRMTNQGTFGDNIDQKKFSAPGNTISINPKTGLLVVFPGKWLRLLFLFCCANVAFFQARMSRTRQICFITE